MSRMDEPAVGDEAAWSVPAPVSGVQLVQAAWRPDGPAAFIGPSVPAEPAPTALLPAWHLSPAPAPASGTPLPPTSGPGGSSVQADVPDVAAALAKTTGDTADAVIDDVAPVARSAVGDVVGTAKGAVGGVGRVTGNVAATAGHVVATTTRTVGDAGRVPTTVVDTAAAATHTIRAVPDEVVDSVQQVHVPQAKAHISKPTQSEKPAHATDVVHATTKDASTTKKTSSRTSEDTGSRSHDSSSGASSSGPSSSGAVEHTVSDVATSLVHRSR